MAARGGVATEHTTLIPFPRNVTACQVHSAVVEYCPTTVIVTVVSPMYGADVTSKQYGGVVYASKHLNILGTSHLY